MTDVNKVKVITTTVFAAMFSTVGYLFIPVVLLAACNVIDYATGMAAAGNRKEEINSYRGFKGIVKKVCMWLLIVLGGIVDVLIIYAAQYINPDLRIPFILSIIVAVWLISNEIISILENMIDIGVALPPFLLPIVKRIKKQVEDTAGTNK